MGMTSMQSRRLKRSGASTGVLAAALSLGLLPGVAGAVHEGDYPGHIHAGSCEDLGDVVFPLGNASVGGLLAGMDGEEAEEDAAEAEMMGSEDRVPVATSYTVVEASLEDILAEEYAINYHESEENIQNYVACGDLGGTLMEDAGAEGGDLLVVGLRSLNDSGISGVATLEEDNDETIVTVFLAEDLTGVDEAPPVVEVDADAEEEEATPAAEGDDAATTEVAVDIADFAYDPDPIELAVGGTVTWTNLDRAAHTATGRDRDVLDSGRLREGESFDQTFEEAGTFEYRCAFHPNMTGTVVVE